DENHQLAFAGTSLQTSDVYKVDQVPMLLEIMEEYTIPVILAGNMNAKPINGNSGTQSRLTYEQLATQFIEPCAPCLPNFSKTAPLTYSDMILYKTTNDF